MKYLSLIFYFLLNKIPCEFYSLFIFPVIYGKVLYQVFVGNFLSPIVSTCLHIRVLFLCAPGYGHIIL